MGIKKTLVVRDDQGNVIQRTKVSYSNNREMRREQAKSFNKKYGEGNWKLTKYKDYSGLSYREKKAYAEEQGSKAINLAKLTPSIKKKVLAPKEKIRQVTPIPTGSPPSSTIMKRTTYVDKDTGLPVSIDPSIAEKDPKFITLEEYEELNPFAETFQATKAQAKKPPAWIMNAARKSFSANPNTTQVKIEGYTIRRSDVSARQPPGFIRPTTPQETRVLKKVQKKERSAVGQFIGGIKSGVLLKEDSGQKAQYGSRAESLGATLGVGAAIASLGVGGSMAGKAVVAGASQAARGTKVLGGIGKAAKAAPPSGKAIKTVQKVGQTRAAQFLKDIGIVSAEGYAISEGGKKLGEITAPVDQRQVIKSQDFKSIMGVGYKSEKGAISQEAWYKSIGYEISPFLSGKKDVFKKAVTEEFKSRGYSGKELESAVNATMRQRKAAGFSEIAANINIARGSERVGRKLVSKTFEKAGKKGVQIPRRKAGVELFKKTYINIGQAGVVEGAAQEFMQQQNREQEMNLKSIGIMAGFGGISAGLIGGTIAGTRIKRPGISKTVELATYITDPFEKPGDVAQDLSEFAVKKITGKSPKIPVVTEVMKPEDIMKLGVGRPSGKKKGKGKKVTPKDPTISLIFGTEGAKTRGIPTVLPSEAIGGKKKAKTPTIIKRPVPITKPVPVTSIVGIPGFPVPAQVPIGAKVPTDIQSRIETPVGIPIDIPIDLPIQLPTKKKPTTPVPTDIPVDVPIPINIPITIPTVTPQMRVPPPLPFAFPAFGSGAGGVSKSKKTVINELKKAQQLMRKLTGI